jgi:hypothetical protein
LCNEIEPGWDESKDKQIVNWKRARLAIEHENSLTNYRVTWLLSAQGFLLAAYMLVFTTTTKRNFDEIKAVQSQFVLLAIVIAGVFISFFLARGLKTAHDQHNTIRDWWYKQVRKDDPAHFPICGQEPRFLITVQYYKFPFPVFPVWIILSFVPFITDLTSNQNRLRGLLAQYGPMLAVALAMLALGFLIGRTRKSSGNDA